MKIGAGGLQSLITQELTARQVDPAAKGKPVPDPIAMQQDSANNVLNQQELNKAVETMQQLANLFNQNVDFKLVKNSGAIKIQVREKRSNKTRDMSLEEAEELLSKAEQQNKGHNLDRYA